MLIRAACSALALATALAFAAAPAPAQTPAELRAEAEAGDAHAAYAYGFALTFPETGQPDYAVGRFWLNRAAQAGEAEADHALGLIHRDGVGSPVDLPTARGHFERGWRSGFAPSGLALAELELYAFGQPRAGGLAILEALGEDEVVGARARLVLAEALFFGVAGDPDPARGVTLARSALTADTGLFQAHYLLGVAAMDGVGREADPAEALAAWRRGAEAGDPLAMTALGDAYATGLGTDVDLVEARALFGAAAAYGEPGAAEAAQALEAALEPAQRDEARRREAALLGGGS